jgi:hypothetical protein
MQYAFAFQKALLTDIVRFEPKAITWLHGISWQLGGSQYLRPNRPARQGLLA